MEDRKRKSYGKAEILIPALYIVGVIAGVLGLLVLLFTAGRLGTGTIIAGGAAIVFAQLLELLFEIADHLAAIRAQVGKGVLGLLG